MTRYAGILLSLLWVFTGLSYSATWTVSKSDQQTHFSSIQAAINAAQPGDIIEITDFETYEEQITFDSTSNITLKSTNPLNRNKPVIKWQDRQNVGPTTCTEAQVSSKITFDRNGALRVISSKNIIIDGICVDGAGAYPFAYPGIWNCKDELFHGNAGIVVFTSGKVMIRNCEVRNAYFGIYMKDRNIGGIFAQKNPSDYDPTPAYSGFGKTGLHIIEYNRIHSNSWGLFFESTWDQASTVRYNLIYSNYHNTETLAAITNLAGREFQPGGAIQFKDGYLSPLAIYNNTFWNNYTIMSGHWKPGGQHIIFNNIYGKPKYYWGTGYPSSPTFRDPWQVMDGQCFIYRSKHCLYSAQKQPPVVETRLHAVPCADSQAVSAVGQVNIMNGIHNENITSGGKTVEFTCPDNTIYNIDVFWAKQPGALISSGTGPFPADAEMRWLETDELFQSTDPQNAGFLVPKWDDSLVVRFIKNKGWPEAGIRNSDGKIADIGAISSSSYRSPVLARIEPLRPVLIQDTDAKVEFNIEVLNGQMSNPRIKYLRWIEKLPSQSNAAFGATLTPLQASAIRTINISGKTLTMGVNTLEFTIPPRGADTTWNYGFFEMVIEGDGPNGTTVNSDVGFLPYRKMPFELKVQIQNASGEVLSSVQAGKPVKLSIKPYVPGWEELPVNYDITDMYVGPSMVGAELYDVNTNNPLYISDYDQNKLYDVYFSKNGLETILASGICKTTEYMYIPFLGLSDPIKVLPGDPEKLIFRSPTPKITGVNPSIIVPGHEYPCSVLVMDRFENPTRIPAEVTLASLHPQIGDVIGSKTVLSDTTGIALFKAQAFGNNAEIFDLEATLTANGAKALGSLKIGRPRDRLCIFYGDTASISPDFDSIIDARPGIRVPVVIRAMRGDTLVTSYNTDVEINVSPGILVYPSEDASDPKTIYSLVNGELKVWIMGIMDVANGTITVTPTTDNNIVYGTRESIYLGYTSPVGPKVKVKSGPAINLIIYDLRGRVVGRVNDIANANSLKLINSRYPAGSYIIRIVQNGKIVSTQKRFIGR